MDHNAFRILDANFNRASEGLRVVEDFLRFARNDGNAARIYKQLRHDLTTIRQKHAALLIASRDTLHDVGVEIQTPQETLRTDARHVAEASQSRCEQALRCIEEYLKTVAPEDAVVIEQLRYRLYDAGDWQVPRPAIAERQLYALLDGRESPDAMERMANAMLDGGVQILQWRDKTLGDRELLARARRLRTLTRESGCLLIINDRPDIAVLCDADGVHVGQDELQAVDVRTLVGPRMLIGVSTHAVAEVEAAAADGIADYIGCGPVFPSNTKQFPTHVGLRFLNSVASVPLPAFAIGGIDLENVAQVTQSGFHRIAVGHAITGAECPATAAQSLRAALQESA